MEAKVGMSDQPEYKDVLPNHLHYMQDYLNMKGQM